MVSLTEMAARADQLHPTVIVEEVLAEILGRIGHLAPAKPMAMSRQKLEQRLLALTRHAGGAIE